MERVEIKSQETGAEAPLNTQTGENLPANGENSTTQESARPAWLPEKFNSPEDLAKAYSELEKQFTQKSQATEENQNQTQDAVNQIVENAGLNMTDLTAEYEQSGKLSDESYEKLSKAGVNREYVDGYIRGQEALAMQYQSEVFNLAGGREGYTSMIQWASQNLTQEEINAFNTVVNGGDLEQAKMSVRGLHSRFSEAEGNEPSLVKGTTTGDGSSVFRSTAELVDAMANPKYKTDPAYRQDIIDKLGRSNIF